MKDKVLVTGGAGFIGSHLVDKLIEDGLEVYVVDDLSGGRVENVNKSAVFCRCDLRDVEKTAKIIENIKPEIIFHLAANAAENKSAFSPIDITSRNWNAFINCIVPAIKSGMKRFVFVSSIAVYGSGQTPFKEEDEPNPEDLYGLSKLMIEKSLKILSQVHHFEYVIARAHNVYGPRQNMRDPYRNVVMIFMNSLLRSQPYHIYGDGNQIRCFSYVANVVDALYRCGFENVAGMTFNIGSSQMSTINKLSKIIQRVSQTSIRPIFLPDRPLEVKIAVSDHTLAKKILRYRDKVSLFQGIKMTWDYAQSVGYQEPMYTKIELENHLTPENWTGKDKRMIRSFAGITLSEIAKITGTPAFVFDAAAIESNYKRFLQAFSKYYPCSIYFSVKTNNELQVLKKLKSLGSGVQVSGGLELYLSERAGFPPKQMIWDGPCKNAKDLRDAYQKGIFSYNADSVSDIVKVNEIGRQLGKKLKVGIRINPNIGGHLARSVEFYISKFGIPISEAQSTITKLACLENIDFTGLHVHIGSQVTSIKPFLETIKLMTKLAHNLKQCGVNIKYLDFGGGIPSTSLLRYSPMKMVLKNIFGFEFKHNVKELEEYGESLSQTIAEEIKKYNLENMEVIFEPGRAIVSNAGIVITKVIAVKNDWAFVDASITFIPENVFFTERNILATTNSNNFRKYNIAGSSLLTPDFFARAKELPELKEEDLLVIQDCGAYTMSRSSQFTTMRPPIYMIDRGKIIIIRRPDKYENFTGPMVN